MDAHPAIVFRDGPTGRRVALAAGPDVWEVVRAVRSTRDHEPNTDAEQILNIAAEATGLPRRMLDSAIAYYADYPDEIDRLVADADRAEREATSASERRETCSGDATAPRRDAGPVDRRSPGRQWVRGRGGQCAPRRARVAQGRTHPGILLVSSATFPMVRGRSVRIAAALVERCRRDRWPMPGQIDFLQR